MTAPTVVFVADGSRAVGAGHQVRCAAIAAAIVARGARAVLACRDAGDAATAPWTWRGLETDVAPATLTPIGLVDRARERLRPDAVVIDHYGFGAADLGRIAAAGPCALIDDLGGRDVASLGLIVDPTIGATAADHAAAPTVAGAAYAALRQAFAEQEARAPEGGLVVVALGATDPGGFTAPVCRALLAAGHPRIAVATADAVVARAVALLGEGQPGRITVHRSLDAAAVAALFRRADVVVVSASALALEAAAVAAPFVAVVVADNQRRQGDGLRRAGVGVVDGADLAALPRLVAAARDARPTLAVDGRGAERIAERVVELARASGEPGLRGACWDDADLLLAWANDPLARAASFQAEPIARARHLAWFSDRLADPESRIRLLAGPGSAQGVFRLQRERRAATVSIAVAPDARGRGVGRRLLAMGMRWTAACGFADRLVAWIKPDNAVSRALFQGCGFRESGSGLQSGVPALRYEREAA